MARSTGAGQSSGLSGCASERRCVEGMGGTPIASNVALQLTAEEFVRVPLGSGASAEPTSKVVRVGLGLGIRRRLRSASDVRYRRGMRRLGRDRSDEYKGYLTAQVERSLSKRANDPGVGARALVREVARWTGRGGSVLCLGCRNGVELDLFRARGLEPVGVDLFSQRRDILVMDMHDLLFPDDSFDAVYASHSLEHSYDLDSVLSEIQRIARDGAIVAVEVPVRHKGSDADLIEFSGVEEVRERLSRLSNRALLQEEHEARTESNGQGSAVARLVLRVEKPAAAAAPARQASRTRRRVTTRGVAIATLAALSLFVLLPEALGDRPYNPIGEDSRQANKHTHAPPAPPAAGHSASTT